MNLLVSSPLRLAFLGFVAALSLTARAHADEAPAADPPVSPARALFREARELTAKGDYVSACPKFEQSLALEPGLGTQFNLADCWEHIGRTASAQALFVGAAASAKAAGQSDREQVLRDRAAALEPRIPHLVIEVEDPDPKLVVKRGDLPLDSDVYGKAKAVDPGSYEIMAKAPGKEPWKKSVEVPVGSSIVTVTVPHLAAQKLALSPPAEAEHQAPLQAKPAPISAPPAEDRHSPGPNYAVLGLGALGVGGLAVGTIMAFKYRSANSDAKNICPSSVGCSTQQISAHDQKVDDASSARTVSFVGFGVGGLSFAAAAVLLFLPHKSESAWLASPVIGNDSVGANLSTRF